MIMHAKYDTFTVIKHKTCCTYANIFVRMQIYVSEHCYNFLSFVNDAKL